MIVVAGTTSRVEYLMEERYIAFISSGCLRKVNFENNG